VGPPRIRFYAGAPLKAPNGHRLGTLCVIDRIPRELSDDEKAMLTNLAEMVVGEIVRKVDAEADRFDRITHMISGTEFFDSIADERGCAVLLFDIDDVLASHDDDNSGTSPGEVFAHLLHDHFPTARSIAHIGDYHFCVSLGPDKVFDDPSSDACKTTRTSMHLVTTCYSMLSGCFTDMRDSRYRAKRISSNF
jgi:hypothetical protein